MKKSLIFKILYLFLGLVVMAGASVFATNTFLASQVTYGNTNVENALNDLYTLKGNDENYSTEEQIVGKWIDGKPIYRKVFSFSGNIVKNSNTDTGITVNNIDTIITGWFAQSGRGLNTPAAFWMDSSTQVYYYSLTSATQNETRPIFIILEYTKTTD